MNAIKKTAVVIMIVILAQLLYSCGSCFGEKKPLPFYDVKGYEHYSSARIIGTNQLSNDRFEELAENEEVAFDRLVLFVRAQVSYHAAVVPTVFMGTYAYACDPAPNGYRGTSELLESLSITSEYDFDDAHPKGTSLNDLFDVYRTERNGRMDLSEYLNQQNLQAPESISFALKAAPIASELQKFRIVFNLSKGEEYSTETRAVRIQQ